MNVCWHDSETVELKLALCLIAEERIQKQFGIGFALKVPMLKEGGDGDCVGFQLGSQGLHEGEHTPWAKARSVVSPMKPKAKALGYLVRAGPGNLLAQGFCAISGCGPWLGVCPDAMVLA